MSVFVIASFCFLATSLLSLIRIIIGPTAQDRLVGLNLIVPQVVAIMVLMAINFNRTIYPLVLLTKVYLASFKMIIPVITGQSNPRVVHFRTRLKSELARVVLANSITLTPGTLTLDLDNDHLIVHWLDAKTIHSHYAAGLIKGHFESWLKRIWM
ncbi:unnamed protein product [marine sediment metagenome]|uniref:Cation antiporter n=1 Tax=marine sediment metagenome TaxID=412755 RepID=X1I395_9ZZZZ